MKKMEIEELLDHICDRLNNLEVRIVNLEDFVDIDDAPDDPLELALEDSGYEDLEAEAFVEGYMRAEEDLTQ